MNGKVLALLLLVVFLLVVLFSMGRITPAPPQLNQQEQALSNCSTREVGSAAEAQVKACVDAQMATNPDD